MHMIGMTVSWTTRAVKARKTGKILKETLCENVIMFIIYQVYVPARKGWCRVQTRAAACLLVISGERRGHCRLTRVTQFAHFANNDVLPRTLTPLTSPTDSNLIKHVLQECHHRTPVCNTAHTVSKYCNTFISSLKAPSPLCDRS